MIGQKQAHGTARLIERTSLPIEAIQLEGKDKG